MENQGKRKDQVKFNTIMAFVGFLGIGGCLVWALTTTSNLFKEEPMEGPTHNYWTPPNKETPDWTGTTQEENTDDIDLSYPDEDVMWIGDNGDTIWE